MSSELEFIMIHFEWKCRQNVIQKIFPWLKLSPNSVNSYFPSSSHFYEKVMKMWWATISTIFLAHFICKFPPCKKVDDHQWSMTMTAKNEPCDLSYWIAFILKWPKSLLFNATIIDVLRNLDKKSDPSLTMMNFKVIMHAWHCLSFEISPQ